MILSKSSPKGLTNQYRVVVKLQPIWTFDVPPEGFVAINIVAEAWMQTGRLTIEEARKLGQGLIDAAANAELFVAGAEEIGGAR